ncbi:hypothetical protein [Aurantimonas coralicida]|uniref:hypothetical protein n=1 Tax=Aurantimonas coralicida TaxID=182270 RepID=UPI0023A02416|nr:hypothetical protein [Aurantimonas coralicida]MDE0922509.1 hypothetical protein [Aurantimonas coralicida]
MGRPNNATPVHVEKQCVDLFAKRMTLVDIAKFCGIRPATVRAILDRADVKRRVHTINSKPEALTRCAELISAGMPVKTAVRAVNSEMGLSFSASTYYEAMIRAGLYAKVSKDEREAESEPTAASEQKTEVHFDGMVIRKMWVNGISLPAVGLEARAA